MLRIILAVVHLLALGVGLGSIFVRARSLHRLSDAGTLRTVFAADTGWGVSAMLFIGSGLWRWLGGIEKPSAYYTHNHIFFAKMGMLGLILALEIWPMITLIRWRIANQRGGLDVARLSVTGKRMARISDVQTLLLIGMVFAAVMMARGYAVR